MPQRRSPLTPQFTFDEASGRYRNVRSGRYVPRTTVRIALDDYIDAKGQEVRALAEQLRKREVSIGQWQKAMEENIAKIHLANAAAAKGGWSRMEKADFGRVGGLVRYEYQQLRNFAKQIENGLPLDGHFLQRTIQYSEAGRHSYHVVETQEMLQRGLSEQRFIRHARDSCEDCLRLAALGWHPTGSTPEPGERKCRRKCRCGKEYRKASTAITDPTNLPDELPDVSLTPEQAALLSQRAQNDAGQVADVLKELVPTPSQYSGQIVVEPKRELRGLGTYLPNGDIGVAAEVFDEPHLYWPTVICETLHAHSPGNIHRAVMREQYPGLEEGLNEQLQRLLRPKILQRLGVQVDEDALKRRDENHAFNSYIEGLEAIRKAAGAKGEDAEQFYREMLQQPLDKRLVWIKSLRTSPDADKAFLKIFALNIGKLRPVTPR